MDVYHVEGQQLRQLINELTTNSIQPQRLSVGVAGEAVTFKIGTSGWSPPMASRQP